MTAESLLVWLYGEHVATLERSGSALGLSYTDAARWRWGLGHPLVSLSLPIAMRPHRGRNVDRFFDGLLPEGQLRRTLAYDFHLPETDTFGLLGEIGRDCAGALIVQSEREGPPSTDSRDAEPVSDTGIAQRIANLPLFPLGVDQKVRVSLAGVQHKLLVVKLPNGWGLPTGAPSSHIVKPAIAHLEHSVENEAFCMGLAHRVGLRAAVVEVCEFAGRKALVVERFDRVVSDTGAVRRIHQEDVNQALGIGVGQKYEAAGGPSLRRVAKLLKDWRTPRAHLRELLGSIAFVVAVGDADHHAKNISLLHDEEGGIGLAPLYDLMCTRWYPGVMSEPGMFVDGIGDIDGIGPEDLVTEGVSWGLSNDEAATVVHDIFEALPDALEAQAAQSPWLPPTLLDLLQTRADAFCKRLTERVVGTRVRPGAATVVPSPSFSRPDRAWVHPYRREDGTPVKGHWRKIR